MNGWDEAVRYFFGHATQTEKVRRDKEVETGPSGPDSGLGHDEARSGRE